MQLQYIDAKEWLQNPAKVNGVPPLGKKECLVYVNPYGRTGIWKCCATICHGEKTQIFRLGMQGYVAMFDGILMQRAMNLYISFF